ncbi:hypothetical protein TW86_03810 [Halomonas sp. S2151]|uniref:hypothetical protein n=1 Tax=Halomonas sp. S2151 TaxID=579478 RepID=UPI0005FA391A|nr:hypothetical protein [Halomonas sp. S2151]KJZ17392.1 hypothetical protein TW86_03810 [Halomonas sp. S2151]
MRDKIEAMLESPGWVRLFKAFSCLWVVGWLIFGLIGIVYGEGLVETLIYFGLAIGGPVVVYLAARLVAWIIRGFLN